jgi:hypothetical protein
MVIINTEGYVAYLEQLSSRVTKEKLTQNYVFPAEIQRGCLPNGSQMQEAIIIVRFMDTAWDWSSHCDVHRDDCLLGCCAV